MKQNKSKKNLERDLQIAVLKSIAHHPATTLGRFLLRIGIPRRIAAKIAKFVFPSIKKLI